MKKRQAGRSLKGIVALLLIGASALAVAAVVGRRKVATAPAQPDVDPENAAAAIKIAPPIGLPGRIRFSVPLPSGAELASVSYFVQSPERVALAKGTVAVAADQSGPLSYTVTLPSVAGATVTFVGHPKDPAHGLVLMGQEKFDVPPGATAEVAVAGGGTAAPAGGDQPAAGVAKASCEACELASTQPLCDPPNLTATSKADPDTGEQTAIGWGCSTLTTSQARDTCVALLRCIESTGCGHAGENPVMACYCGEANAQACLAGQGISGACVAEYKAAAAASGGTSAATESVFVATSASNPTTAVGLADNVARCALDSRCGGCGSS
jgi:hypothetical protein